MRDRRRQPYIVLKSMLKKYKFAVPIFSENINQILYRLLHRDLFFCQGKRKAKETTTSEGMKWTELALFYLNLECSSPVTGDVFSSSFFNSPQFLRGREQKAAFLWGDLDQDRLL